MVVYICILSRIAFGGLRRIGFHGDAPLFVARVVIQESSNVYMKALLFTGLQL